MKTIRVLTAVTTIITLVGAIIDVTNTVRKTHKETVESVQLKACIRRHMARDRKFKKWMEKHEPEVFKAVES